MAFVDITECQQHHQTFHIYHVSVLFSRDPLCIRCFLGSERVRSGIGLDPRALGTTGGLFCFRQSGVCRCRIGVEVARWPLVFGLSVVLKAFL